MQAHVHLTEIKILVVPYLGSYFEGLSNRYHYLSGNQRIKAAHLQSPVKSDLKRLKKNKTLKCFFLSEGWASATVFAVTEFSLKDSSPCLSSASDVVQGNINFAHTCPGMLTILLFLN